MTLSSITAGSGPIASLASALDRLNDQNSAIQSAITSGVQADSYAGLGDQRSQALSLQPEITRLSAWQQNVTTAQSELSLGTSAFGQIAAIGAALQTSLTSLESDRSPSTIQIAASQARQALSQLASLANTRGSTGYVFAGVHSDTAPITDPGSIGSSALVAGIAASVASVGANGAAATEAATVAAAADNGAGTSVFAPALSVDPASAASSARSVMVGVSDSVRAGFVLTQGVPASAASTGSSIRDLMRALAVVASLPGADSSTQGYADLVADTTRSVTSTNDSLIQTQSQFGQLQNDLSTHASSLSTLSSALNKQLEASKGSDPASLSTALSTNKAQLTAAYSLIADMKGLSLAAYLS